MDRKAVFVTATGTDIGKTYVSALLVKKMRNFGFNCGYYKPALSGAIKQKDGSLLPGDCDFAKFAGIDVNPCELLTYCFEEAVSPHLASARAGINIELSKIVSDYRKSFDKFGYLLVEGAGGITCPFNLSNGNKILLPDVIKALELGIVIVADGGLGTINSVLLTVDYAKANNLPIKGIILNNFDKNSFMHIDNKIQVENLTGLKVLATVAKDEKDLDIDKDILENLFI